MSFSFNFVAATKAAAKTRLTEEMCKVVAQYGIEHARDLPAAIAAGHAYIDVLAEDPTKDICVAMYGSLVYLLPQSDRPLDITSAGVTVSAGHVAKKL